jgi:hypothetical protein
LVNPRPIDRITRTEEDFFELALRDGATVLAKAVVLATGATYRKLDIPEYDRFIGRGIHHAATIVEAQLCAGGRHRRCRRRKFSGSGRTLLKQDRLSGPPTGSAERSLLDHVQLSC